MTRQSMAKLIDSIVWSSKSSFPAFQSRQHLAVAQPPLPVGFLLIRTLEVICQGITGQNATFHTEQTIEYDTKMAGGVTPVKGGTEHLRASGIQHGGRSES
ncbi:hypothetical protein SLE2022_347420 [Rubroshorea leprosula]